MRVMVEISDEQVVAYLQQRIRDMGPNPLKTALDCQKFEDAMQHAIHINRVITYLGGRPERLYGG